jgi:hypothetical protein
LPFELQGFPRFIIQLLVIQSRYSTEIIEVHKEVWMSPGMNGGEEIFFSKKTGFKFQHAVGVKQDTFFIMYSHSRGVQLIIR